MVDIHTHLLFDVDDGAESLEESIAMLQEAKKQGITAMILTPHYRHGMFRFDHQQIKQNFLLLFKHAKEIGMKLSLGTEFHVNSHIVEYLQSGRCVTLAGTNYVLVEYSHETEFSYIRQMNEELLRRGYVPVIAHVERYQCLLDDISRVKKLKEAGAMIQVNCDAVLGKDGRKIKKFAKKLVKNHLLDVIASDSHGIKNRACHMAECYSYVAKKFGKEVAWNVMENVPRMIFESPRMEERE